MNESEILRLLNAKTPSVRGKASKESHENLRHGKLNNEELADALNKVLVNFMIIEEQSKGLSPAETVGEFAHRCAEHFIPSQIVDELYEIYSAESTSAAQKSSTEAVATPISPAKYIEENLHESEGWGDFGIDLQELPEEMRPKIWSIKATSDNSVYIHWVTQEECYYVENLAYVIREVIYGMLVSNGYSWEALGKKYRFTVHLEAISRDGADYGEGEITFGLDPSKEAGGLYNVPWDGGITF